MNSRWEHGSLGILADRDPGRPGDRIRAGAAAVAGGCRTCAGELSLEIRWIIEGGIVPGMTEWLGPVTGGIEQRRDCYLVGPTGADVGVKIRGGTQLDVKVYGGSPGGFCVRGPVAGALQWWRKWSYPLDTADEPLEPYGWRSLVKTRHIRRFSVDGQPLPPGAGAEGGPGCSVELTCLTVEGRSWWTLGFEATGPEKSLEDALGASASLLFARDLPAGVQLDPERARSYPRWLEATNLTAGP